MKRSKMVEVIKEYLDLLKDESLNLSKDTQDQAEYILGCCETWGMLPPRIDFMIGEMRASDNAWESEE